MTKLYRQKVVADVPQCLREWAEQRQPEPWGQALERMAQQRVRSLTEKVGPLVEEAIEEI